MFTRILRKQFMWSRIGAGTVAGLITAFLIDVVLLGHTVTGLDGRRLSALTVVARAAHSHGPVAGGVIALAYGGIIGAFFGWLVERRHLNELSGAFWGVLYAPAPAPPHQSLSRASRLAGWVTCAQRTAGFVTAAVQARVIGAQDVVMRQPPGDALPVLAKHGEPRKIVANQIAQGLLESLVREKRRGLSGEVASAAVVRAAGDGPLHAPCRHDAATSSVTVETGRASGSVW
jgi:hypothetical protein